MLAMRQIRLPTVGLIFEKDENGCYTKPASLYQGILRYSLNIEKDPSGDSKSFRHWDLARWLMNNNQEFINRYKDPFNSHTTTSNIIENTRERTKNALSDLMDLRLIYLAGTEPQREGTGIVHLYKFAWSAFLFGWLIEGTKPNKRGRANDAIFKSFDSHLKTPYTTAVEAYYSRLYYNSMREVSEIINARNIDEFLEEHVRVIRVKGDENRKIYLESWKETMDELDPDTKKLAMHSFKLEIESKMRERALDLETFEKMRFDFRDKYDKVIVVGRCDSCHGVLTGNCNLLEYMIAYNHSSNHNVLMNCNRCQTGIIIVEKPR
jgi:hypothetical protein